MRRYARVCSSNRFLRFHILIRQSEHLERGREERGEKRKRRSTTRLACRTSFSFAFREKLHVTLYILDLLDKFEIGDRLSGTEAFAFTLAALHFFHVCHLIRNESRNPACSYRMKEKKRQETRHIQATDVYFGSFLSRCISTPLSSSSSSLRLMNKICHDEHKGRRRRRKMFNVPIDHRTSK